MSVGLHEIATVLIGLVVGLIGFLIRDTFAKLDRVTGQVSAHGERLAVLDASTLAVRVDDHDARLAALEARVSEIAADVKVIRSILEQEGSRRS